MYIISDKISNLIFLNLKKYIYEKKANRASAEIFDHSSQVDIDHNIKKYGL